MQDKNEIILTPAKSGYGLTDPERLETARLMLKAGYRVELEDDTLRERLPTL